MGLIDTGMSPIKPSIPLSPISSHTASLASSSLILKKLTRYHIRNAELCVLNPSLYLSTSALNLALNSFGSINVATKENTYLLI